MRITGNILVNNMMKHFQQNMNDLDRLNQQLASGKEFQYPSQAPIKVTSSMQFNSMINNDQQFQRNIEEARNWINSTENALNDSTKIIQRIRELAIYGAGGTHTSNEREAIATEIEQLREELITIGNKKLGSRYIFGGQATAGKTFDSEGNYQGDNSRVTREVNSSINMPINVNGKDVIKPALEASQDVIDDLRNGRAKVESYRQVNTAASYKSSVLRSEDFADINTGDMEFDFHINGQDYAVDFEAGDVSAGADWDPTSEKAGMELANLLKNQLETIVEDKREIGPALRIQETELASGNTLSINYDQQYTEQLKDLTINFTDNDSTPAYSYDGTTKTVTVSADWDGDSGGSVPADLDTMRDEINNLLDSNGYDADILREIDLEDYGSDPAQLEDESIVFSGGPQVFQELSIISEDDAGDLEEMEIEFVDNDGAAAYTYDDTDNKLTVEADWDQSAGGALPDLEDIKDGINNELNNEGISGRIDEISFTDNISLDYARLDGESFVLEAKEGTYINYTNGRLQMSTRERGSEASVYINEVREDTGGTDTDITAMFTDGETVEEGKGLGSVDGEGFGIIKMSIDGEEFDVNIAEDDGLEEVIDKINNEANIALETANGVYAREDDGRIKIRSLTTGEDSEVNIIADSKSDGSDFLETEMYTEANAADGVTFSDDMFSLVDNQLQVGTTGGINWENIDDGETNEIVIERVNDNIQVNIEGQDNNGNTISVTDEYASYDPGSNSYVYDAHGISFSIGQEEFDEMDNADDSQTLTFDLTEVADAGDVTGSHQILEVDFINDEDDKAESVGLIENLGLTVDDETAVGADDAGGEGLRSLSEEDLSTLDNISEIIFSLRADLGAKVNRLDLTENRLDDEILNLKKLNSENEDIDLAEKIMDLKMEESVYRASLSVGARIMQPSLVEFMR